MFLLLSNLFLLFAAVIFILTVAVRFVPKLNAQKFYLTCMIQAYAFYWLNTLKRKLYRLLGKDIIPYGGSTQISASWMQRTLEQHYNTKLPALSSVEITTDKIMGGLTGKIMRIRLHWTSEPPAALDIPSQMIVKSVLDRPRSLLQSVMLGTPREALFSREYGQNNRDPVLNVMPRVFYARGSWLSGDYVTVMEDLSLQSAFHGGVMLGNQCWGAVPVPDNVKQDPLVVIETIFMQVADIHAKFWRDESLLQFGWLKNVAWLQGRDRARWDYAFIHMREMFDSVLAAVKSGATKVPWSAHMIDTMTRALDNTHWSTFRARLNVADPATPYTLCHGDFHPSNILWCPVGPNHPAPRPYIIDWSEVGVFCPFTELAQFIISHVNIEMRRAHERGLFERYHQRLIAKGVDGKLFPLDQCWQRYQRGGIERWLQMLVLLARMSLASPNMLPDSAITWFYHQVSSFVDDHGPACSDIALMSAYCVA